MRKVLCIGHSAYDITLPIREFPEENKKYNVKSIIECGGGPAGNAACLIAKWGLHSSYAGILGKDIYGTKIRDEYQDFGVDLEYLVLDDHYTTPFSFILANSENGSRTLFNYDKQNNSKYRIRFKGDSPDTILVDGHALDASIDAIKKFPGATSILDGGSYTHATETLAGMVDFLVCSEDFAKKYTGVLNLESKHSIDHAFKKLEMLNRRNIIVTLGERGSLYKNNGKIIRQKAYEVEAKDTTGAGDIFHGAFAFCITQGFSLEKTLKISSIAAALSVQKLGGRISIPSYEEVLRSYEKEDACLETT